MSMGISEGENARHSSASSRCRDGRSLPLSPPPCNARSRADDASIIYRWSRTHKWDATKTRARRVSSGWQSEQRYYRSKKSLGMFGVGCWNIQGQLSLPSLCDRYYKDQVRLGRQRQVWFIPLPPSKERNTLNNARFIQFSNVRIFDEPEDIDTASTANGRKGRHYDFTNSFQSPLRVTWRKQLNAR